jgi:hypothetical protein
MYPGSHEGAVLCQLIERKENDESRGHLTRLFSTCRTRTSLLVLAKPALLLLLGLLIVESPRSALSPPSLLRPSLLALLDVPPRRAAAALAQRNKESQDRRCSRYPHEREHLRADCAFDVELLDGRDGVLHDDEEHGCDHRGYCCEERGEEGEDRDEQADPARVDCDQLHWDHDEGEAGAGEEEGEHPV